MTFDEGVVVHRVGKYRVAEDRELGHAQPDDTAHQTPLSKQPSSKLCAGKLTFDEWVVLYRVGSHPGVELRANLRSISNRCYIFEVAFV